MSVTSEAMALIDGYSEKESERDRARRLLADAQATDWARVFQRAAANVEAALQSSTELDEIRAAIAGREAARADFLAFNEITSILQDRAKASREKIDAPTEDAVAPALAWLGTQMSELMSFVRELDDRLGSVSSVDDAIRGDDQHIKAWRDLEDTADRYQEIRQAQERICRMTGTAEDGPALTALLNRAGRLRNAFDHDAQWIWHRTPTSHAERLPYNRAYLEWRENPPAAVYSWQDAGRGFEVWPAVAQGPLDSRAPRAAERTSVLRWLARHSAAWVPTFAELRAAARDLKTMSGPVDTIAQTRAALEAWDRSYTKRGVTPVTPLDVKAALTALPQPRGLRDNRDAEGRTHADPRIIALVGE